MLLIKDVLSKISSNLDEWTELKTAKCLDEKDSLKNLRIEFHYPKSSTLPQTTDADFNEFWNDCRSRNGDSEYVFLVCYADLKLIENPEEECVYLCTNSLGLMPKCTAEIMNEQFQKWSHMGVFGHFNEPLPWCKSEENCLDKIAEIVGAKRQEVVLMNSLTINIHLLITAFYKPTQQRNKILLESQAFPSDHYAIESQIRLNGFKTEESMICLQPRQNEETLRTEDILNYIENEGDSIALIFFSGIQYYTGQFFDIEKITKAGHAKGCLVGWDLAHCFINVPLKLHEWNVDFACWCTYKYSCSGAGGIGGAFIHSRYANDCSRERMLGWWSHKLSTRFNMDNKMDMEPGALGYRISNPPFMLSVGMLGFLQVYEKTSIEELRQKSYLLTGYMEFLLEKYSECIKTNNVKFQIITPKDPQQRGCQLSLKFNCDIISIYEQLIKRGIAVDKRYPNVIRAAPAPLYNTFEDCWRFAKRLFEAMKTI